MIRRLAQLRGDGCLRRESRVSCDFLWHAPRTSGSQARRTLGAICEAPASQAPRQAAVRPGRRFIFRRYDAAVQFAELVATSNAVAQTPGRLKKTDLLATCLRQMGSDERAIGARCLASTVPHKT